MHNPILYLLIFVIAATYASAGFGGASGYLLAMSFFNIHPHVMSSTALVLNIFVSTISFVSYFRAGHFRPKLILPFLFTSIPAAFLGGTLRLSDPIYTTFLYAVLTYLALRLTFFPVLSDKSDWIPRPVPLWAALVSGVVIGLLSGIIGIGGGIFLSPLIILAGWGNSRQAAAASSAFIAISSVSGFIGRVSSGTVAFSPDQIPFVMMGVAGSLLGSSIGAVNFSNTVVRRTLGLILVFVVSIYWLKNP